MALVDVIAPPDFVLDSPIGRADGQVRAASPSPPAVGASAWGASWPLGVLTAVAAELEMTAGQAVLVPSGRSSRGQSAGSGWEKPGGLGRVSIPQPAAP